MTENSHIDGYHEEAEFEREDLAPKSIFTFFVGLAVVCVLGFLTLNGMYRYLDAHEYHHQPPQNPLVQQPRPDTRSVTPGNIATFPQPRLASNERLEINDFRVHEEQTLNNYGWVDEQAGVVRIPIDRAMQLLAQRGLPTRPQDGTVRPSDGNAAREGSPRSSEIRRQQAKRK